MIVDGEAHPESRDPAHEKRVPRIRTLSVEWDVLSAMVLFMRSRFVQKSQRCFFLHLGLAKGYGVWASDPRALLSKLTFASWV